MALETGARIGSYEVTEHIGSGGMGEVYRAADTTLERDVAIKILPESFASDVDRTARFEQEAKTLAALNHPNIAQVFGLERSHDMTAIVMELVEGPTLADHIEQGPIPPGEALDVAMQIANALEAAHEKGIVHRDLKPANIKLRPDGTVKVLDFGIAKAFDPVSLTSGAQSPVMTTPVTQAGLILGTAAYMSPEQARGKQVDQRSDIWAFGCVLYEMLTGQSAFAGEDVPVTLARVIERDTDLDSMPASISPTVRQTIRICLQKNVTKRIADIRDVRLALEGAFESRSFESAAGPEAVPSKLRGVPVAVGLVGGGIIAGLLLGLSVFSFSGLPEFSESSYRFSIAAPPTLVRALSISPNGRYVAFVALDDDSANQVWLRDLEGEEYRAVEGTESVWPATLFWSPDSETLAFIVRGELMRASVSGIPPEPIVDVRPLLAAFGRIQGGAWSPDGTILLGTQRGIVAVPQSGDPFPVTESGGADVSHSYPAFLPDGRRFVFLASTTGEVVGDDDGIYLGTTDRSGTDGDSGRILRSTSPALFVADGATRRNSDGYLVYERGGRLLARSFDSDGGGIGEELILAQTAPSDLTGLIARPYSAAATGTLVYLDSEFRGEGRLVWYDRSGNPVGQFEEPRNYQGVRLSAGYDQIFVNMLQDNGIQLTWYSDLDFPRWTRVAAGAAMESSPEASATGRIALSVMTEDGVLDVFGGTLGRTTPTLWWSNPNTKHVNDFSADGRFLIWDEHVGPENQDLFLLEIGDDGAPVGVPIAVAATSADESFGQFSPNADWIAYDSNEEGPYEVYVKPFIPEDRLMVETRGAKVSGQGGRKPRWSADGRELYYLAPGNQVMVVEVEVEVEADEGLPRLGVPQVLFEHPLSLSFMPWVVSADGRFLFLTPASAQVTDPIHVFTNWTANMPD